MPVVSADYTRVVTECRAALAVGGEIRGPALTRVIDVVEDAANTLDSKAVTAVAALEALLVTHLAILVADGASPTQGHVNAMVAALATPRSAATAAAAPSIADIATHALDGRSA